MKPAFGAITPFCGGEEAVRRCVEQEEPIVGAHLRGMVFTDADLSDLVIRESLVENCRFTNCTLQDGEFRGTCFRSCDFSGSRMRGSYFSRCTIDSCKGVGCDMRGIRFREGVITDGLFDYANLDSAVFFQMLVENGRWKNAQLSYCKISRSVFQQVDFSGCSFDHTALKGVDLSSCIIHGIQITGEELKGAVVDLCQAAELARLLGIIIKDQ